MNWGTLFLIALLLACPLMMVFMHRGGHGGHSGHAHGGGGADEPSLDDLRGRRNALDAQIAALEEQSEPDPEPEQAEELVRPATPVAP